MENNRNRLIGQFNEIASQYDSQRKKLIPCFDDFYRIPLSIADVSMEAPNVLDIGAGTGLASALFLEKYPKAALTLIDISENMLEAAKARFKNRENIKYIAADYTQYDFEEPFDLVISSLSIHHLTDPEKKSLYAKVFGLLKNEGLFINADQVLGGTAYLEQLYKTDWKKKVEASGLSRDEIETAYERTKLDKMATLEEQISWLREIGFSDVDCVYKYFNFVVLLARKIE